MNKGIPAYRLTNQTAFAFSLLGEVMTAEYVGTPQDGWVRIAYTNGSGVRSAVTKSSLSTVYVSE